MTLRLEPLEQSHELGPFDSGHGELDRWLREHALSARAGGTRTYVLVESSEASEPSRTVVGYFAIAPHLLAKAEAPGALSRGAPEQIPGVLLAKLALSRDRQGQGLGSELLVRALGTILEAARSAGGRIVVVDAIDEERSGFYIKHDFQPLPGNPTRLVIKLSTVAKALGVGWP